MINDDEQFFEEIELREEAATKREKHLTAKKENPLTAEEEKKDMERRMKFQRAITMKQTQEIAEELAFVAKKVAKLAAKVKKIGKIQKTGDPK